MDFDRDGAARELDAAERLGPANSTIARQRSRLYFCEGDIPRALAAARRGVQLDPVSGHAYWVLGWVESVAGDNVASERDLRRALELVPGAAEWHTSLARTLLSAGRPADALAEIEREPERMFGETLRPIALDALGRHAEADAALARAVHDFGDAAPDFIARVYGSRGDVDATLSWVERAYRVRAGAALYYKVDPAMDPVRKDPRYVALIRKLKLPE